MSTQHNARVRHSASDSRFERHEVASSGATDVSGERSWRATAALLLSLLAIGLAFVFAIAGLVVSLAATALSVPARESTIRRDRPGRGQAKVALYLGLAGIVLNLAAIVVAYIL
jgi:hypothetical protein